MIHVWFVVAFMFAGDATDRHPYAIIPDQIDEAKTDLGIKAIKQPISRFENIGPAFRDEKTCLEWASTHAEAKGGVRLGCSHVDVTEIKK